jgi:hypothetical protein
MREILKRTLCLLLAANVACGSVLINPYAFSTGGGSSYLLSEDWNTGSKPANATDTGSPDYSSGNSVTFHMGDTSLFSFTGNSTVGVYFEITPSSVAAQQTFWIRDSSGAMVAEFRQRASGAVRIATGAQLATSSSGVLTAGVKSYVWLDYVAGVSLTCYVSSTTTKGSALLTISTGVDADNAAQIFFGSQTSDTTYDKLRVASSPIGDNPS